MANLGELIGLLLIVVQLRQNRDLMPAQIRHDLSMAIVQLLNTPAANSQLASVLRQVNQAIGDPHYEVGISFFLRTDLGGQIEDIWQMEIEPYLEEYFFDQLAKVNDHRWDKVRETLGLGG